MGMLLMLTRHLHTFYLHTQQELWQPPRPFPGIELNGRTAVVLGVGGVGTQIAFRSWAHGMNVIGVDPEDIPYMPIISKVVRPDQLDSVLPETDVVFVAAPHTLMSQQDDGTTPIRANEEGVLFHCRRRRAEDLDELAKALESQHLAGAGVDMEPDPRAVAERAPSVEMQQRRRYAAHCRTL